MVQFLAGGKELPLLQSMQTGSLVNIAFNSMVTGSSFPMVKYPGHEGDHLSPSSVRVKNEWNYMPLSHVFMTTGLRKQRNNVLGAQLSHTFFCSVFQDPVSNSHDTASNDRGYNLKVTVTKMLRIKKLDPKTITDF
jgi:hypothetical protein